MRAWKTIDAEHAAAVAQGSLRIGTLQAYKDLENGRADDLDGGIRFTFREALWGHIPEHRQAMNRLGFSAGTLVFRNISETVPPLFAFCMTHAGCRYDPDPNVEKAIFRIRHAGRLARRICQLHDARFAAYGIAVVQYAPREFDILEVGSNSPDPFTKDPRFAEEREIRIVFHPRDGVEVTPFVTAPDPEIANLLSLVADKDAI